MTKNIKNGSGHKVTDGQNREVVDNNGYPASVRKTKNISAYETAIILRLRPVNPTKIANQEREKQLGEQIKGARKAAKLARNTY